MSGLWNERWCCFVCARHGLARRAVIRVFSGIGGGGFPACSEHIPHAESAALAPLREGDVVDDYTVTACRVVTDEHDAPQLGEPIWHAKKGPRYAR